MDSPRDRECLLADKEHGGLKITETRLSKYNSKSIVALGEEAYYIEVDLGRHGFSLKLKDFRDPSGPLVKTPRITIDSPEKLLSSSKAKPIRDALKKIFHDEYEPEIYAFINILQTYGAYFEVEEEEPSYKPKGEPSKAELMVDLAIKVGVEVFRDQFGMQFAKIPIKSGASDASEANSLLITPTPPTIHHIRWRYGGNLYENSSTSSTAPLIHQIWPIDSEMFKQYLSGLMFDTYETAVKKDHIGSALLVLQSMANKTPKITLSNRIASDGEDGIFIDLTNDKWEAIHVTKDGYSIIPQPTLFKRYPHQIPLCYPSMSPDITKLFKYINIGCPGDNERHVNEQLLFLVALISAFISDIPHVGTVIHGGAGKIKSMTQIITRKLIDPSSARYNALPKGKQTSLIQILEQHYYTVFDNMGDLDNEISDSFCRAITGASFQLRKLFTNDEAFLRAFKRVINMNGINIPGENPDLLDRVIVFEAPYVPMKDRKTEKTIYADFERDSPHIFAAILKTLVKAIQIYPTIKLERLPRMADFAMWGCAITEAIGIPHQFFINAYYQNMLNVKGEVVKSRVSGRLIIQLLDEIFENLPSKSQSVNFLVSDLFSKLMTEAEYSKIDKKELPPDPTRLSRELNVIASNLPSLGYSMTKKNTNKGTQVTFSKLKETTLDENLEGSPKSFKNEWPHGDLAKIISEVEGE